MSRMKPANWLVVIFFSPAPGDKLSIKRARFRDLDAMRI
jgi:hypothetical protein